MREPGFNPLWINTALKLDNSQYYNAVCFNPLWINTALKHHCLYIHHHWRFNPLWINTALKRMLRLKLWRIVSIPYGLTLLSNRRRKAL